MDYSGAPAGRRCPGLCFQFQPGTTLPIALRETLRPGRTPVGSPVRAYTTQRTPVALHAYLRDRAELTGSVVTSSSTDGVATLSIRFTRLRYEGRSIPVIADAVAIASIMNVNATGIPANGSTDRENSNPASWTTAQVGGDEVYRSGWVGPVCDATMKTVGFADFHGVYALPPGQGTGPDFPLALGVFSTNAAGLYGFDHRDSLRSAGGTFTISGPVGEVVLRRGYNLLLKVIATP